ncbi:MAG: hypothetical protein RKE49_15330 [Oceanicaulis sp.]
MAARAWWRDFSLEGGAVRVRKTGALVPVEPGVVGEVLAWLRFHLAVAASTAARRADGPSVWFAPDAPRAWYLIAPVMRLAGLNIADTPETADIGFFFEDATTGSPPAPPGLRMMNGACKDVSKSHVSDVFEQVSGRALAVDPETFAGAMAVKSEKNGAHDGRVVNGPCPRALGLVYQRLVDNLAEDGLVEDLRCPTVDGEIPVVFMKRRPAQTRFANANAEVMKLDPRTVFSAEERRLIKRFCAAMGLEWGGLDVLRDRRDGMIWIVDVNKTDMGPPTALPLSDKMAASRTLALALRAYAERLTGAGGHE